MFISFIITHHDFRFVNSKHFNTIATAINNCVNDNHYVHIYFASTRNIHRYDHHFKHRNIELIHKTIPNYTNDIEVTRNLFQTTILDNGFDYHWMIRVQPDHIILDKNIFVNIRNKYNPNFLYTRLRYYVGRDTIKKNQRSYYDHSSIIKYNQDLLFICDNQFYMIPHTLQYYAFKTNPNHINNNLNLPISLDPDVQRIFNIVNSPENIPEKTQTILWNSQNVPIKINDFNIVSIHNLYMYNNTFYDH